MVNIRTITRKELNKVFIFIVSGYLLQIYTNIRILFEYFQGKILCYIMQLHAIFQIQFQIIFILSNDY